MTTWIKVTCDGCGADLTDAGAMPSYRLALEPEPIPNSGGHLYAVHVVPPITRPHHFCNFICLDKWRGHEREAA